MSHFSVIIVNTDGINDIDEQLEPFDESIEVPEYVVKELPEDEKQSFIDYYVKKEGADASLGFEKLYKKYGESWNGNTWKKRKGVWVETSTYNPKSQWDWYEIGGRWAGMLKLKENCTGEKGSLGLGTKDVEAGYCSQTLKKNIDIEGMRKQALESATKCFDVLEGIVQGENFETMAEVEARLVKEGKTFIENKEQYWEQSVLKRFKKYKESKHNEFFGIFSNPDEYKMGREAYLRMKTNGAISAYAFLLDGEWNQHGKMVWFGCSNDEMTQTEWNEKFNQMFDELPDDALVTVVDCHI